MQSWSVAKATQYPTERGDRTTLLNHVARFNEKNEPSDGPPGTPITCDHAFGMGVSDCIFPDCSFNIGFSGSGASIESSGGDVWNGAVVHGLTCNLSTPNTKDECEFNQFYWNFTSSSC